MAIYADLVSRALLDGDQESDIAVLTQTALMARLAITTERAEVTVPGALADQISYDRSLIRLCRACGIDTEPRRFEQPAIERGRLENVLSSIGVDFWVYP
jgi:hypothetical protein